MKKIILLLIFFNILTLNSKAEIAYIDINFILNTSEVGKSLNIFLDNKQNENNEKYKKIETELIKREKLLITQQNILSKDDFEKKIKLLSDEVKKYRSEKKKSFDKLKQIKIDNTKEILSILNPIITKYVDLNSISIVIPKKNIIVGKKNLDITEDIVKLLNDNIKKLNL